VKVVDLSIKDNPDRPVVIAHRLVGGRAEIDDGQTAVPEPDMIPYKDALVIRASMRQGLGHSSDRAFVHRRVRVTIDLAADTAHDRSRLNGVL